MSYSQPVGVIGIKRGFPILTCLTASLFSGPALSLEPNPVELGIELGNIQSENVRNRGNELADFLKGSGKNGGDDIYADGFSEVLGAYGNVRHATEQLAGRTADSDDDDSEGNGVKACSLLHLLASPSAGRTRCSGRDHDGYPEGGTFNGETADNGTSDGKHCLLIHDFRAVPPVSFIDGVDFGECAADEALFDGVPEDSGCTEFWLGNRENNSLSGSCTVFENRISFTVERPDAVRALFLDTVHYDDYIQLWISPGTSPDGDDFTSYGVRVLNLPNSDFPPETGGKCELGKSRVSRRMTDLWPVILRLTGAGEDSVARDAVTVTMRQRVSVTGSGEGYMNFRLFYDNAGLVEKDYWGNSECLSGLAADNGKNPVGRCLERFAGAADVQGADSVSRGRCIVRNSVRTCHGDFKMPDFISSLKDPEAVWDPLCRRLDVYVPDEDHSPDGGFKDEKTPADEGSGVFGIITENVGVEMSGEDRMNTHAQRYASDFPEIPEDIERVSREYINGKGDTGDDVMTSAVMLQALQYMQNDISCGSGRDSERSCRIFAGTENSCRKGYFGSMDCCHAPNTADAETYIRLITYMAALRTAGAGLEGLSSARGAWADGALLGSSQGLISGIGDSIMGTLTSTASEEASREFMQALTVRLADLVQETMGEAAREALFTETVSEEGISMVEMNPAVMGTAQGVMAAYVAYQTFKTMKEIATSCRPGEIETSMKIKLDSCTHTGRSCTKKVLGKCVVHEEHYCCYSSPLARIVMEQLPQDYSGGRPCAGIPVSEMSRVDFSSLDLSEWLKYVEKIDLLDAGRMTAGGLTGTGSALNVNGRADVTERTRDRLGAFN